MTGVGAALGWPPPGPEEGSIMRELIRAVGLVLAALMLVAVTALGVLGGPGGAG